MVVSSVLAAAMRVVNAAFERCPDCARQVQRPDRQIALHAVTDGPADHAAGMQIQECAMDAATGPRPMADAKIHPALAGPNVTDVTCPFLVWFVRRKVSIQ